MTSNMAISPPELVTFAISDNDDIIKKKKKDGILPSLQRDTFHHGFYFIFFIMGHGIFDFYINNGNSTHVLRKNYGL